MIMQRLITKNIFLLSSLLALVACSDDEVMKQDTNQSDNGKTPIAVTALLDANGKVSQTRAEDKQFSTEGDELKVMLRHVTWTGKVQSEDGYVQATDEPQTKVNEKDLISKLVTFTATGTSAYSNTDEDILPFDEKKIGIEPSTTNQAATLTADPKLYWDDFSIGGKGDDTDIRTDDHYLQSYYGYCYNGGSVTTALNEAAGTIGWTVSTDQTSGFKTSDLLWSPAQKPVRYDHATANKTENHGQVVIPFLHAMSKVTIKVTAGEGFRSDYDFKTGSDDTQVELKDIRLKCTAEAPTATLTYPGKSETGAKGNVKMKPGDGTGTRSYSAIVVPSILTVGNTFATITNMDGDTYNIPITDQMVAEKTDKTGWGNQLDNAEEDVDNGTAQARPETRADGEIPAGKGHQMRSGVHYVLNVTINKTGVNVSATILDWDEVEADGIGEIHFENDVNDKDGKIQEELQESGFDVYMKPFDATDYGPRVSHLRYNKTSKVWKYDPVIYWQGGKAQDFRALSNVRPDAEDTTDKNESLTMENGRDALWGTTAKASGYEEGQAVNPRTGDVPLKFYHAMSMITFNLVDALKGSGDLAEIDLHGATIQLTNLANGGTLNLSDGKITPVTPVAEKTFSEDQGAVPARMGYFAAKENDVPTTYDVEYTLKEYIITPQTIGDDALVVVTLADGTVYKAQLNKCTRDVTENGASTPTEITKWERGVHYTYTITLGKETITFRALIENWDDVEGGGKATLEWD